MDYSWVQGWTLQNLILKNLDIEKHFNYERFPKFEICFHSNLPEGKRFAALYHFNTHLVQFSTFGLYMDNLCFAQTYFHELIHSTTYYNERFFKMWKIVSPADYGHITGLEERIADIGSLVLMLAFSNKKLKVESEIKKMLDDNKTEFSLPWRDLEEACLFYAKETSFNKIKSALQLVKNVITDNNLTNIYEGNFNGQCNKTRVNVFGNA